MKILHAISALDLRTGGPVSAMLSLAEAQRRAGAEVSVVATHREPDIEVAQRLERQHIPVRQIGPCTGALMRCPQITPVLRQIIPEHDVVHVHAVWEEIQYQCGRACRAMRVPYVVTPHGMLDPWSLRQGAIKKRLYLALRLGRFFDGAAAIHFTSQGERAGAAALKFTAPRIVIPLGLDLREFESLPAQGGLRARHPQLQNRRVVMYLGRIFPRKGLELLIPAFAQCGVPDAMLVIVGPDWGGYLAHVHSMVAEHRIQDRVVFTGMLGGRDRLEALVDAYVLALPSFHENFGLAVVEALACGVPVIVSNEVNIHPEISDAGVGAVVPTQVKPLADALRTWLTGSDLRAAAAARARPFVQRTYDLNRIADTWLAQYQSILAARHDPRPRAAHADG